MKTYLIHLTAEAEEAGAGPQAPEGA